MFGLLNNQRTQQLEKIAQLFLKDIQYLILDEILIQNLSQMTSFPYYIKEIMIEDLNGSLDERLIPLSEQELCLKIPQSVPSDIKQLLIAKGVARWVLQLYQDHLNKPNTEDYLYGSDWTHTQNDEIHYLALCLLMPETVFKTVIEEIALNRTNHRVDLERLSDHFKVSEQAIIQRGISLNLFSRSHCPSTK